MDKEKEEEKKCRVDDPEVGTRCTCKSCLKIKASLRKAYSKDGEYKYYTNNWE